MSWSDTEAIHEEAGRARKALLQASVAAPGEADVDAVAERLGRTVAADPPGDPEAALRAAEAHCPNFAIRLEEEPGA